MLILPATAFAFGRDLTLNPSSVTFSTNTSNVCLASHQACLIEGKLVRIYATVDNLSQEDLRGVVRFFDAKEQIQGDQPVSVIASRNDSVFVDWNPDAGEHNIKVVLIPFDAKDDDPANNTVSKTVTVLADFDRDGIPNISDPDDDNDGVADDKDAFPLNKNEWTDSDGDTIGNNKDDDDDNDGVKDSEDAMPLNANETLDTDKDGIGNNEDTDDDGDGISDLDELKQNIDPLNPDTDGDKVNDKEDAYPLDPTQAYDYDRDGISDAMDPDADNDGIPKDKDVNDTNLGPEINITSNGEKTVRFVFPDEPVSFETTNSIDPDGKIAKSEWTLNDEKTTGPKLDTKFLKTGIFAIGITLTDDKGESSNKTITVYAIPRVLPWITVGLGFIIIILALFTVFSYSKRRNL